MTDVKLPEPAKWVWDAIQDPREQAVGIAEAMRAYATAVVMADRAERWRPISIAPSGKPVIVCFAGAEKSTYIATDKGSLKKRCWYMKGGGRMAMEPTHWQPLPTPPEGE